MSTDDLKPIDAHQVEALMSQGVNGTVAREIVKLRADMKTCQEQLINHSNTLQALTLDIIRLQEGKYRLVPDES